MKKFIKATLATALTLAMLTGCFAGSGTDTKKVEETTKTETTDATKTEETTETKEAETTSNKVQSIVYDSKSDPMKYDPRKMVGVDQRGIANQVFTGLYKFDEAGLIVPSEAVSYENNEDFSVYTFKLREDIKWSDGKPVTAADYEWAWKTALTPEFASTSANLYFILKNGQAYNTNEATIDDVGIKAIDDRTLEVTLENPDPFLLEKLADIRFCPVRSDIAGTDINGDDWTMSADTYIGNGPFKISSMSPKSYIEFVKNENYFNASNVKLEKLKYLFIEEASTSLTTFETGEVDIIESIPPIEVERMLEEGTARNYAFLATYYYSFNMGDKPKAEVKEAFAKKEVRHALSLAIDRENIVKHITKGGQSPATGFSPAGILKPDGTEYVSESNYLQPKANVEEAKKLLADAGYPNGEGFPEFELFYNSDQTHEAIAQAIQDMWKQNLGINCKLVNKETKVFAEERKNELFDMTRSGNSNKSSMFPEMLNIFLMQNKDSNDPKYDNAEYTELVLSAEKATDINEKLKLYRQAEDILMDDMPVIPIYYYTKTRGVKPDIRGFYSDFAGTVYFETAYRE